MRLRCVSERRWRRQSRVHAGRSGPVNIRKQRSATRCKSRIQAQVTRPGEGRKSGGEAVNCERAKLRTNAPAATPSRALAIGCLVATEALCALPISFPNGEQRRPKAGREIWVPLWAPKARCRQVSERSGARSVTDSASQETARDQHGKICVSILKNCGAF